jgi:hypothetical protein
VQDEIALLKEWHIPLANILNGGKKVNDGEKKAIKIPEAALSLLINDIKTEAKERDQKVRDEDLDRLQQQHVCIRIFEDDSVIVTHANGLPIEGKPQKDLKGAKNTYAQALWYNHSPT